MLYRLLNDGAEGLPKSRPDVKSNDVTRTSIRLRREKDYESENLTLMYTWLVLVSFMVSFVIAHLVSVGNNNVRNLSCY